MLAYLVDAIAPTLFRCVLAYGPVGRAQENVTQIQITCRKTVLGVATTVHFLTPVHDASVLQT